MAETKASRLRAAKRVRGIARYGFAKSQHRYDEDRGRAGAVSRRPAPVAFKATLSVIRIIADVETFVIRIWTPDGREDDFERRRLRGVVEHIGSGERDSFRHSDELLTFLVARLGAPRADQLAMRRNR